MKQLDFICLDCPIKSGCDEESVWCALRWATNPNDAQRSLMGLIESEQRLEVVADVPIQWRATRRNVKPESLKRREYFKTRYREKKQCTTA